MDTDEAIEIANPEFGFVAHEWARMQVLKRGLDVIGS
jgi:hypothetical protein